MTDNTDLLYKQILNCIREKREIPNPLIYQFSENVIKIIRNREAIDLTQTLADLVDETDAFWRRVDKSDLPSEFVFNAGRVFTLTAMIKKYYEAESSYFSPMELSIKYSTRYTLFRVIKENPGIIHKDLASHCGISQSALSQLMVSLQSDHVVSSRNIGRNKYYYLSNTGITVLNELNSQKKFNNRLRKRIEHNYRMKKARAKYGQPAIRLTQGWVVRGKFTATKMFGGKILYVIRTGLQDSLLGSNSNLDFPKFLKAEVPQLQREFLSSMTQGLELTNTIATVVDS